MLNRLAPAGRGGSLWLRVGPRLLCAKSDAPTPGKAGGSSELTSDVQSGKGDVKIWGQTLDLPEVTKEQAEEAFLDTTDVKRALTPPVGVAVNARDDMLKDRFNYVSKHVTNPAAQYVVMGANKEAVIPAAIGQGSFLIASLIVLMGGIGAAVYVRTQWGVTSGKELGDRLREKGASKKEALERSTSAAMVRSVSATAETTVKSNVELVRKPSQQMGAHFQESFKGVVKENRGPR